MKVGVQLVYQAHSDCSDAEMFRTETQLAVEAGHAQVLQRAVEYFESVFAHYELGGDHFEKLPSYAKYAEMGRKSREIGPDAYRDIVGANLCGTPDEIIDLHLARRAIVGDYDLSVNVSYGSMPWEDVYEQLRLFADRLLPQLKG